MYNNNSNKKQGAIVFKHFGRKGYSLFACLGREVLVGVLSVATLQHASAGSVSVRQVTADTIATKTDLWDSGRTEGSESHLVKYSGNLMPSMEDCWWTVRIWDAEGKASRWAEPAHWTTGMYKKEKLLVV